jgi:ribosomal protein S18 acetylase RimI-like enzyme
MCETLPSFYDGDHYAHARRLFDTHMAGHQDTVGHFSYEQVIFIVEDENVPVGFVNLVGKKQGNYKISPLILDNQYRGKKGYGTVLFGFIENYVLQNSCRQLYCTVAAANTSALTFFLKKGFRIAGVARVTTRLE